MKHSLRRTEWIQIGAVIVSAFIYALGINTFVKSGNLFPGGFSGFSRLVSQAMGDFLNISIPFSAIYFLLNVITTLIVWQKLGHWFVILSVLHYSLSSVFAMVLPQVLLTHDILLIAVFGGLVNGFAVGMALRNNASSGGTDFISIYFSTRFHIPMWNYIFAFNAVVLFVAGILYGWNQAMYSIIFQFISTQVVNMMHERFRSVQINVVTNQPEKVCAAVFERVRHGITKIPCEGGFTGKPHYMLVLAINTFQQKEVTEAIRNADPAAFITVSQVERIIGNYYQKPLD